MDGDPIDDILQGIRSPPDRERFREVLRLAQDMEAAETAFKAQQTADRARIREMATQCLQAVDRGSDRTYIVNHLYWRVRAVSAETIASALRITTRQLGPLTTPMEYEVKCFDCGSHVRVAEAYTRAHLDGSKRPREWCKECKRQRDENRRRNEEESRQQWEKEAEVCRRVAAKKAELDAEIEEQRKLLGVDDDGPGHRAWDAPGWPTA
jgi:hypothetical protein